MIDHSYKYIVTAVILVINILMSNTIPSFIHANKNVKASSNMKIYFDMCRIQTLFPLVLIPVLTFLIQETSENTLFGSKYILLVIAIVLNALASILLPSLMIKNRRGLLEVAKLYTSMCKYPIGSSTVLMIALTLLIKQKK